MNHIELFAGCGGLSLGLETAGFNLLVANELSPMAAETFAYNHLNADLDEQKNIDKVLWVSSEFSRDNIKDRLRENPNHAAGLIDNHHWSDIRGSKFTAEQLKRSLLVGSIIDINKILKEKGNPLLKHLKNGLGEGSVDLVSGGPPCQSFSLAGARDHTNHRNALPWEFAQFVDKVKPKIALLENVSGILRPFKIGNSSYYAWFEVAKAFAEIGYIPLCLHINAKYVGTAQNRPRFIMIALRKNIYQLIKKKSKDPYLLELLKPSAELHKKIKNGENTLYGSLPYYDIEKDNKVFNSTVLNLLSSHKGKEVSVKDAIDDLRLKKLSESYYVDHINNVFIPHHPLELNKQNNHNERQNSDKVRARFRLYQIMKALPKEEAKTVSKHLKTDGLSVISSTTLSAISKNWMLNLNGEKVPHPSIKQVSELLSQLHTKKQTQRALSPNEPAPAALSIPDDACHYHESVNMQRTLTVREMARIQSFPDWYKIKSKVTTGGQMRKFEVPQYTQIGNAVPPLLGLALGEVCRALIDIAEQES
jgi:DNA (cytosine-5)-methyltransferase 1